MQAGEEEWNKKPKDPKCRGGNIPCLSTLLLFCSSTDNEFKWCTNILQIHKGSLQRVRLLASNGKKTGQLTSNEKRHHGACVNSHWGGSKQGFFSRLGCSHGWLSTPKKQDTCIRSRLWGSSRQGCQRKGVCLKSVLSIALEWGKKRWGLFFFPIYSTSRCACGGCASLGLDFTAHTAVICSVLHHSMCASVLWGSPRLCACATGAPF